MHAVSPAINLFDTNEVRAFQSGSTWKHRAIIYLEGGNYGVYKSNVVCALFKKLIAWLRGDKNTIVLHRSQSALLTKKVQVFCGTSQNSASKLYDDMKNQHQGNLDDFLKKVGQGFPDPGKGPHYLSDDPEIRAGKAFILKMCQRAAKTESSAQKTSATAHEKISQKVSPVPHQTVPDSSTPTRVTPSSTARHVQSTTPTAAAATTKVEGNDTMINVGKETKLAARNTTKNSLENKQLGVGFFTSGAQPVPPPNAHTQGLLSQVCLYADLQSPKATKPTSLLQNEGDVLRTTIKMTHDENFNLYSNPANNRSFYAFNAAAINIGETSPPRIPEDFARYCSGGNLDEGRYIASMQHIIHNMLQAQQDSGVTDAVWFPIGMGAFLRNLPNNDARYTDPNLLFALKVQVAEAFVRELENFPQLAIHLCLPMPKPGENQEALDNYNAFITALNAHSTGASRVTVYKNCDATRVAQDLANQNKTVGLANGANRSLLGNMWLADTALIAIDENINRRSEDQALVFVYLNDGTTKRNRDSNELMTRVKKYGGTVHSLSGEMQPPATALKTSPAGALHHAIGQLNVGEKGITQSHRGVQVAFGRSKSGVYIETFTTGNQPVHIDILDDKTVKKFAAHYSTSTGYGGAKPVAMSPDDSLLTWALSIVENAIAQGVSQKPQGVVHHSIQTSGPYVTRSGHSTLATHIIGTKVSATDQEINHLPGYDWKVAYSASGHLGTYASQASNAIISYRGTFSNYQREPFASVHVDAADTLLPPVFLSAEQMFHYYKFPPSDSRARQAIMQASTPDDARRSAQSNFNARNGKEWAKTNRELMVFIQLAKALERKTGLQEALIQSASDFIIEDTSKRNPTKYQEKTWGDNGDGTGENWLGWAQMKARDYINACIQTRGSFTAKDVQDYFTAHVKGGLELYYRGYIPK